VSSVLQETGVAMYHIKVMEPSFSTCNVCRRMLHFVHYISMLWLLGLWCWWWWWWWWWWFIALGKYWQTWYIKSLHLFWMNRRNDIMLTLWKQFIGNKINKILYSIKYQYLIQISSLKGFLHKTSLFKNNLKYFLLINNIHMISIIFV
jgi:hypothetical protein